AVAKAGVSVPETAVGGSRSAGTSAVPVQPTSTNKTSNPIDPKNFFAITNPLQDAGTRLILLIFVYL
ncbi:MAG: hypothetical protein WAS33_03730, partial [Candidatus Promineifilaceae bacterium]